jgi:hypothetical protein
LFFRQRRNQMFDSFQATAPAAHCQPPADGQGAPAEGAKLANPGGETPALRPEKEAHAARLKKFKREQLVVDYLNRGVSVVEIAARIGVGEKRMRAIIREIIARRQPHPPEEFVVIQISRLNEAMLNAFSAMSPKNLKAVAQVVRIVGQLDRYHGFDAADWKRRLERGWQAKLADESATTGGALFCSAELALQDAEIERLDLLLEGGFGGLAGAGARPEIPLQDAEMIDSALGSLSTPDKSFASHPRESGGPEAAAAPLPTERLDLDARVRGHDMAGPADGGPAPHPAFGHRVLPADGEKGRDARPENPRQGAENIDSVPGISAALEFLRGVIARPPQGDGATRTNAGRPAAVGSPRRCGARDDGAEGVVEGPASDERPENPLQAAENVESAPGNIGSAEPPSCHPRESGGPEAAAETLPAERLNRDPRVRGHDTAGTADAGPAPHPAFGCVHPVDGEKGRDAGPENLAQNLDKVESAPGIGQVPGAAPADDPYASPVYYGPSGERFLRARMTANGVMAG